MIFFKSLNLDNSVLLCYNYMVRFTGEWRNWQTQRTQNPSVAISCGFKSHFPHYTACSTLVRLWITPRAVFILCDGGSDKVREIAILCRKLHIACDDFLCLRKKIIPRLFRCSSFPQKVTLGSPARLQAPSRCFAVANNLSRFFLYNCKAPTTRQVLFCKTNTK